ncbi:putative proline rich protein 5 protein [Rosellinia necatrix]|uniref:Putative proline rich protein 5 protein n=1 Tax=Rosellinia necatrix TaxID=77044 RepID=A0A1W2TH87_ROSNE|nr:putative proline rich protein 5 protein [Rosellinia necatrix]
MDKVYVVTRNDNYNLANSESYCNRKFITAPLTCVSMKANYPKCDPSGYLIQNHELYRVNLTTGRSTIVSDSTGSAVNAMGYNIFDDYLYASNFAYGNAYLVKIGGSGVAATVSQLPISSTGLNWNIGDVDERGQYWASYNGEGWIKVDADARSETYGKVVASGVADTLGYTPIDWAYVPGAGDYLWALGYTGAYNETQLMRFDRTAHTWSLQTNFGNVVGRNAWGAVYAARGEALVGSENVSGEVWKFPLLTGKDAEFLAMGPASNNNDGARCINAIEENRS